MENIKFVPKKEIATCTSMHGFQYETKVTLLTALISALIFDDFEIKTNIRNFEPLDDIFLRGYKNGKEFSHLFQLKHVKTPTKLEDNSFIAENDPNIKSPKKIKFDLNKFNEKYNMLSKSKIFKNKLINFIFYTNYELDVESTLFIKNENIEDEFVKFLNTSNIEQSFSLNKNSCKLTFLNEHFMDNSSFLINQQNVNDIDNSIINLLMKFKISKDLSNLIIGELLYYFDNICSEMKNRPIITKSLTLQLLYFGCLYYRNIDMSKLPNININSEYSPHLWNYLKKNKIIIRKEQVDSVQNMIFNHDDSIQNDNPTYMKIIFKHKKFEVKEIIKMYYVQCCCNLLPFLIKTEYYAEIINILNNYNQFQVIFIDDNEKYLETYFNNVSSKLYEEIFKMEICVRNRKKCFIKDLFKNRDDLKLILNNVNVSDFLQLCKIDQIEDETKNIELDRFIYNLKVENSLNNLLNNDIVVLTDCNFSKIDLIKYYKLNVSEDSINYVHKSREINSNSKIIVLNSLYYNKINTDVIKNNYKSKNVHFLKIHQSNNSLFWVNTFGCIKNIKFKESNNDILELKSIPTNFKFNKLIVFSGIPGIGKTIAMKQLSTFIPPNIYVLLIKLSEKQEILKRLTDTINCLKELKLLSKETNTFYLNILELKFRQKDLCVIFDGFDEIAPKFVKNTNNLIKCILKEKIQVVLTTRKVLQTDIEEEFSTKSFSLKPFDLPEQNNFLEQYLSLNSKLDKYKIENMCADIINKIKNNLIGDLEFNSVPLHLKIICDLLLNLLRKNKFDISSIQVDKIKIFRNIIDIKISIFIDKTKVLNFDEDEILEYHESFGMKKIFPAYIDKSIEGQLKVFSRKIKNGSETTGFLVDDAKEIFIHRTIAENFCASFLVKNYKNSDSCKEIITNEIFKKEYYFVNWCFNSLLYSETSVYNKIISNSFDEITSKEINQKYSLDRSVLHLVLLNFDMNNRSKTISSSLEKFFKKISLENIDLLTQKDYFQLTPLDYSSKIIQTNELKITMKMLSNNLYFSFNQNFIFLEFINCKDIRVDNSQLKFNSGLDLFMFTIDKINLDKFNFIFLFENFDKKNNIYLLEDYKIGFDWLIELGETINALHYKAMDINSLQLSNFLSDNFENNEFFTNINDNPLSYAFSNNLLHFIKFFIDRKILIKNNYEKIINILSKFIKEIILNNNEQLINYLIVNNFKLNELMIYNKVKEFPEILDIYKLLLINEINDQIGNTMLHLIIINKNNIKHSQTEIYNKNLITLLKYVIEIQNNTTTQNKNWETPLYLAIQNNDLEIVKILITHLTDINFQNNHKKSYLHSSILTNNLEIMTLLLENKIDLEFADINGDTPLMFAVKNQNLEAVIMLLYFGAEINASNGRKQTSLHFAVCRNNLEITKILLDNRAYIEAADINGDTPLISAVTNDNTKAIEILLENKADIEAINNYKNTALLTAVINKKIDALKILLNNKANIETVNLKKYTPLISAVLNDNLDAIKILIERHANIEVINHNGNTPLLSAVKINNLEAVKYLVENGANIEAVNYNGYTPLLLAVRKQNLDAVKILLGIKVKKANIEAFHVFGRTPLFLAVENENLEIVKLLIDSGAQINKIDDTQSTPLSLAAEFNKDITITKFLLEKGAAIEHVNLFGNTPLLCAVKEQNLNTLKLLIEFGANVNTRNNQWKTPLHIAIENNSLEIVSVLLKNNAEIAVNDVNGETRLSLCIKERNNEIIHLMNKLTRNPIRN